MAAMNSATAITTSRFGATAKGLVRQVFHRLLRWNRRPQRGTYRHRESGSGCGAPRYDPGGGGINVARIVHVLGGCSTALFPAGGRFDRLLDRPPLRLTAIRPAGPEVPKTLRPRSCRADGRRRANRRRAAAPARRQAGHPDQRHPRRRRGRRPGNTIMPPTDSIASGKSSVWVAPARSAWRSASLPVPTTRWTRAPLPLLSTTPKPRKAVGPI